MPSVLISTKDLRFNTVLPDLESVLKLKLSAALHNDTEKTESLEPWEKIGLSMAAGVEPEIRIADGSLWLSTPEMDFEKKENWIVRAKA